MRTLIVVTLMLFPASAKAQSPQPETTCRIRSLGINFGTYSALDPAPRSSLGRIEVTCNPPAVTAGLRVTLSAGRSAQPLDRTMTLGDDTLRYNLFADAAHNRVLGDGSNGTVEPVQQTRALGRAIFRVHAVIWPRQRVPAGEYSDTVRIDVEF